MLCPTRIRDMYMKQMDIVEEIKQICGNAIILNNGWYHFVYKRRHFVFIPDKKNKMIRITIPYVANGSEYNSKITESAVNETNREIKYVKAQLLKNGNISLNYDHMICNDTSPCRIVRHIILTLYVASEYLTNKLELK